MSRQSQHRRPNDFFLRFDLTDGTLETLANLAARWLGTRFCGQSMNETFRQHVEQLHPKFEALLKGPTVRLASVPKEAATPGIYLFSEGPMHLYVGRSKNVRSRLKMHVGDPSGASFAFKLAREACGRLKATYAPEGSERI